ncbi:substrate-binding domain-containing protein [Plastoroseomonas arctica]|uniref:ABC transporter substrate-binding protein n=1 Tax=Plastoroseomonas arctica TaxID=1509237 RepID=A0AAF1K0R7_9PROT|nr:substrate-binding domain-containing protein [Plastoroseomonas arctica]MBR0656888.1 ABC transporter substrate-binding protein [Plastoroseomonas arctica]
MTMMMLRRACLAALLLAMPGLATAADIRVMISGAFFEPFRQVVPQFERATGHRVVTIQGASMGNAPDAIPVRLARGEVAEVMILAAPALDALIASGQAAPGSRVDLVRSLIGMSVRAGARRWDISTEEGFVRALREASSIAYSASASGTYFSQTLLQRMGLEAEIGPKARRILSERVGAVVARGDAELGLQQVSELLPIAGLDFIGVLPPSVQQATIFSAGIGTRAEEPAAARALVAFLAGPEVVEAIRAAGLEPLR